MYQFNSFQSASELDDALATNIAEVLQQAVLAKGRASLAVSGGSTPKGLFKLLSQKDISWDKVTVTLVDERWLDNQHGDSNTKLVKEHLLVNKAKSAAFFPLYQAQPLEHELLSVLNQKARQDLLPFDVAVLGMGEDGHTASLFPCSEQIADGLNEDNNTALLAVTPTTAPYQRISFSFNALKQTQQLFLHIVGDSKKQVFEHALTSSPLTMPISAFLSHPHINLQVFWAK